jgi:hypothetical protein
LLTICISMNTPTTARITSTNESTNPKFTAHISLRCDETQKTLPGRLLGRSQPSTCEILSQAQRPRLRYVAREACFLTRNSRALVVLEWKIVMLDWTMNAVCYPGRPTQAIVRSCLKGRPILAFLRALVGAFKAVKLSSRRTLVSAAVYGEKHLRERSLALAASRHSR